eukprot:11577288-Ditylum_brightwellii.AAC.1
MRLVRRCRPVPPPAAATLAAAAKVNNATTSTANHPLDTLGCLFQLSSLTGGFVVSLLLDKNSAIETYPMCPNTPDG